MKKILIGFTLLASMSVFADTSIEISPAVTKYSSAIYTLQLCEVSEVQEDIGTCDDEIGLMAEDGISPDFIINAVNSRGLELTDKIDGKLTNWFWLKFASEF
jgi:hypothetical protein